MSDTNHQGSRPCTRCCTLLAARATAFGPGGRSAAFFSFRLMLGSKSSNAVLSLRAQPLSVSEWRDSCVRVYGEAALSQHHRELTQDPAWGRRLTRDCCVALQFLKRVASSYVVEEQIFLQLGLMQNRGCKNVRWKCSDSQELSAGVRQPKVLWGCNE